MTEPKLQYIWRYKSIVDEKIMEMMEPLELTNTLDDVFDIAVIEKNNWQMYGSCKPNNQTYKLTNVYKFSNKNTKIRKVENKMSDGELVRLLSIRNFDTDNLVKTEEFEDQIDAEFEMLPKKQQVKKPRKVKPKKSPLVKNYIDDDEDLGFIKSIVKILDPKRADKYDEWMRLGWCLHKYRSSSFRRLGRV